MQIGQCLGKYEWFPTSLKTEQSRIVASLPVSLLDKAGGRSDEPNAPILREHRSRVPRPARDNLPLSLNEAKPDE